MNEQVMTALDEVAVTVELPLKRWNQMLNAFNMPNATPSMMWAGFIQEVDMQASPQVQKAKAAIEAALKVNDGSNQENPA